MELFIQELRIRLKSFVIWCLGISFLIIAGMTKYSAFKKTGDDINALFMSIPESMRSLFGLTDGTDLTNALSFYAIFYLYFLLFSSIFATILGATLLTQEEQNKTADFLYTRTLSRTRIFITKLLSAVLLLLIFNCIIFGVSFLLLSQYVDADILLTAILFVSLSLMIIQTLFFSVSLCLSTIIKVPKTALSISTSLTLFFFFVKIIIELNHQLDLSFAISPFQFFEAKDLIFTNSLSINYLVFSILIIVVSIILASIFHNKRDLRS